MKYLPQDQTWHRDLGLAGLLSFFMIHFSSIKSNHAYHLGLSTKVASVFYQWLSHPVSAMKYYIYTFTI